MAAFLGLAALAVLAGRGLLALLRPRLPRDAAFLLAAPVALALWVVVLSLAALYGPPLHALATLFWAANAALAAVGLRRAWRAGSRRSLALLVLSALLPLLMLAPHVARGLRDFTGVFFGDGWAYVADAQYLWSGAGPGSPSVLHAYASTLGPTRHASAALLAMLSPIDRAGDPQRVVGLFCAFLLFVYASACASLALRAPRSRPAAFLLFAVPAGWIAHVVAFSNYDHAVALALWPAAWSALARLDLRPGRIVLAGLLLAALLYAYPDVAPAFIGSVALGLPLVARRRAGLWRRLATAACAGAAALVVLAPGAVSILRMTTYQFATLHGGRPGGLRFAGLMLPTHLLSGLWGLGGEDADAWSTLGHGHHAGAVLLGALALYGAWRLARGREGYVVLLAAVHGGAAGVLLFGFSYHYGAYKLLSLGFWSFAFLAWQGAESVARRLGGARVGAVVFGLALLTASYAALTPGQRRLRATDGVEGLAFERLRALEGVAAGIWPWAVTLDVEGPATQQWAVYFLRGVPLRLQEFRGYLGYEAARLYLANAAQPSWENVGYLLSDGPWLQAPGARGVQLVADVPPLRLWRLRDDAALMGLARAGQRVPLDGRPARGPLDLALHLRREGSLRLRAKLRGAGRDVVRLRLSAETLVGEITAQAGLVDVVLPLPAGPTDVHLEPEAPARALGLKYWTLELEPGLGCPLPPLPARPAGAPTWLFQDAAGGAVHAWTVSDEGRLRRSITLVPVPAPGLRLAGRGDFDEDGVPDLVFQSPDGAVHIWLLDPRGGFALRSEVRLAPRPAARRAHLRAVADMNGDGRPDLVWQEAGARGVEFQYGCGVGLAGTGAPQPARPFAPSWSVAAVVDADADGAPDLLWEHPRARYAELWWLDQGARRVGTLLLKPPDDAGGWRPVGAVAPRDARLGVLWQRRADGRLVLARVSRDGELVEWRDLATTPGALRIATP